MENLVNFQLRKDKQNQTSPCLIFCALHGYHTVCGVLFICAKVYQSLHSDTRNYPTLSFYNNRRGGKVDKNN